MTDRYRGLIPNQTTVLVWEFHRMKYEDKEVEIDAELGLLVEVRRSNNVLL